MVDGAGAEPVAGGADPGSELGPAVEEEVKVDSELVDWSVGDWVACTRRHWCGLGGGNSWAQGWW